jgi:hypothetical protein
MQPIVYKSLKYMPMELPSSSPIPRRPALPTRRTGSGRERHRPVGVAVGFLLGGRLYYIDGAFSNPNPGPPRQDFARNTRIVYDRRAPPKIEQLSRKRRTRVTDQIGKLIVVAGVLLVTLGLVILFADRIPFVGKLPGDIHIRRGNFQFYFPLVTSIGLSILLSFLFWVFTRLGRK